MKKELKLFKKILGVACFALLVCCAGCKTSDDDEDEVTVETPVETPVETEDEKTAAYSANVTMSTGDTYVPKGFVFLNCELQIESGETAYLSRTGGSNYYDQVAFINTSITGEGTFASTFYNDSSNAKDTVKDSDGNYHVGWKDYNMTKDGSAVSTDERYSGAGTISETLYTAEYSERELILNRVYDLTQSGYAAADDVWDISALKTEFGIKD